MENLGLKKSEDFGVEIIKLFDFLKEKKTPYPIIKQIIKSGTSIGANLCEADCAISDKDFLAKVYNSLKECNKTKYWLSLLNRTDYLPDDLFNSLYEDADEIFRLLSATNNILHKSLNKA